MKYDNVVVLDVLYNIQRFLIEPTQRGWRT